MKELFEKHWLLFFSISGIFLFWNYANGTIQTISIPMIIAYLFLLAKKSFQNMRIAMLVCLIVLLVFYQPLSIGTFNQDEKFSDVPVSIGAATTFLANGKNPYSENYYGTIMEKAEEYNIEFWKSQGQENYLSMEHFVYLPAIFIVSLPYYLIFPHLSFYFLVFIILLLALTNFIFFIKDKNDLEIFLTLAFFNPLIFFSLLLGQSIDFLILLLILLLVFSNHQKKHLFAGITFGLLLATKTYAFIIAPFVLLHLWNEKKYRTMAFAIAAFALAVLPFMLWDFNAFTDDTIFFITGEGKNTLNIWNDRAGFFPLLKNLGVVDDSMKLLSFLLIASSAFIVFIVFARKKRLFEEALLFSALAVTAALFFSKALNPNYLSFPYFLLLGFALSKRLGENGALK